MLRGERPGLASVPALSRYQLDRRSSPNAQNPQGSMSSSEDAERHKPQPHVPLSATALEVRSQLRRTLVVVGVRSRRAYLVEVRVGEVPAPCEAHAHEARPAADGQRLRGQAAEPVALGQVQPTQTQACARPHHKHAHRQQPRRPSVARHSSASHDLSSGRGLQASPGASSPQPAYWLGPSAHDSIDARRGEKGTGKTCFQKSANSPSEHLCPYLALHTIEGCHGNQQNGNDLFLEERRTSRKCAVYGNLIP